MATTTRISTLMIGLLTIAILCTTAAGDKVKDNFNDGQRDTSLWRLVEDSIQVREKRGYLESRNRSSSPGTYWSGYESKGWNLCMDSNYTFKGTYEIGQARGATGSQYVGVGICLDIKNAPNADIDEVYIGFRHDVGGYWLIFETFDNGTLQTFDSVPIQPGRTKLKLRFNSARDRLDISVNGKRKLRVRNFNSKHRLGNNPEAKFGVGAQRFGNVKWGWSDFRTDDILLKGQLR